MDTKHYIGIDIASKKFDASIFKNNAKNWPHKIFSNSITGFKALLKWLPDDIENLHICMEATGIYWEDLANFLYKQGIKVSVVNPYIIKNYAHAQMIRSKTDKLDCKTIARFVAKEQPSAWQPLPVAQQKLNRQLKHLSHLKDCVAKERIRLHSLRDEEAIQNTKAILVLLEEQLKQFESVMRKTIQEDEMLRNNLKLLQTIPAVGINSAMWLLATLGNGSRFKNGKAAATYMGLTPMEHQSGSSINGKARISKMGNSHVRHILYLPVMAFSFGRYQDCCYKPFVNNLLAKGKPKKVILVALMRKIVVIAQTLLQRQTAFDENIFTGALKAH